jgi:hypothetical protein
MLKQRGTYRLLSEEIKEFVSSVLSSKGIVPHSITSAIESRINEVKTDPNP